MSSRSALHARFRAQIGGADPRPLLEFASAALEGVIGKIDVDAGDGILGDAAEEGREQILVCVVVEERDSPVALLQAVQFGREGSLSVGVVVLAVLRRQLHAPPDEDEIGVLGRQFETTKQKKNKEKTKHADDG